jgi:ABC-type dipeptide/oligopeptide/nickel transport system ATPase component
MADLHYEFNLFYNRIALTYGNKVVIQMARETIRERIRRYFRDTLKVKSPMFRGEGAYVMNTMVNPTDGEYDIDDGVYLQHLDQQNDGSWPTADTAHCWLVDALDGHCGGKAEDKRNCVRIRFRGLYRVDLSVYGQLNGRLRLAVNGQTNWLDCDPMSPTLWFGSHVSRCGAQLRRVVCYIKAWADFQTRRWGEMPDGFILTILAVQHYQNRDKDDAALAYTLKAISTAVGSPLHASNPVYIDKQLTERLSHIQKIKFQKAVEEAAENALEALSLADAHKVSKIWRKVFGDRFPKV